MVLRSCLLITFFCLFFQYSYGQKVGVVLSGGGAKGLAHIGTLKALEENHIPIDYITGTSMGGIVGAMYAAGYAPAEMEKIAMSPNFQDWVNGRYQSDYAYYFQKNAPNASAITAKLTIDTALRVSFMPTLINDIPLNFALLKLFSQASATAKDNFDHLMVPYRCMVSDVLSQKSIAVNKGSLGEAVRATMTVPLIYRPVKIDGKYVFDGGIYNNFPADVMKNEFHPDYIIGANVSSKTFNEYPKNDDRVMNRFLSYLFLSKSDSTLIGKNGAYIQPDLKDFSVTNFTPVAELIKKGYDATMAEMPTIKKAVKKRVSAGALAEKRDKFNAAKPKMVFSDVTVEGVNSQQAKYIKRLFKSDKSTFDLNDIERGYYKLVADETFETVYPKISYQTTTDNYVFGIVAQPKKAFRIDFGGNISTRPISNVFLGLQYNYLNRKAYTFNVNLYSGRFYESAQIGGRIDFPSGLPLFFATELTYNHWNYYNTSQIFIENPHPTYIEQADRKIDFKLGMPLNKNARLVANVAFINNGDKYSPSENYNIGDKLDRTVYNGFRGGLTFEKNSLNKKQYPTAGNYLSISANATTGRENFTPGNTPPPPQLPFNFSDVRALNRNYRQWLHLKITRENYFLHTKRYVLGYLAEGVLSNQPLYANYYGSLLAAPAFYPLQDSKSVFLTNFRATNYLAGGIKNIFNIRKNLELRLEGYAFLPHKAFVKTDFDHVVYAKAFSKWYYAATAGLVYSTPLGPISLSYNLYDDPIKRNGVLLHLGYLIYNKRSLE